MNPIERLNFPFPRELQKKLLEAHPDEKGKYKVLPQEVNDLLKPGNPVRAHLLAWKTQNPDRIDAVKYNPLLTRVFEEIAGTNETKTSSIWSKIKDSSLQKALRLWLTSPEDPKLITSVQSELLNNSSGKETNSILTKYLKIYLETDLLSSKNLIKLLKTKNSDGNTLLHNHQIAEALMPILESQLSKEQLLDLVSIQNDNGRIPLHYHETTKVLMPLLMTKFSHEEQQLLPLLTIQNKPYGRTVLQDASNIPFLIPLLNKLTSEQLLSVLSHGDHSKGDQWICSNTSMHKADAVKALLPVLIEKLSSDQWVQLLSMTDNYDKTPLHHTSITKVLMPVLSEKLSSDQLVQLLSIKSRCETGDFRSDNDRTPLHDEYNLEILTPFLLKKLSADQLVQLLSIQTRNRRYTPLHWEGSNVVKNLMPLLEMASIKKLFQLFAIQNSYEQKIDDLNEYDALEIIKNHQDNLKKPLEFYQVAIDQGCVNCVHKMAKKGDPYAMLIYGRTLLKGTVNLKKNEKDAFKWIEKSATQGNLKAKVELARCLERGIGVTANPKKALEICEQAAKQKEPTALYLLSGYYQEGIGVSPDGNKSLIALREAVALEGEETFEGLKLYFSTLNQNGKNLVDDKTADILMPMLEKKLSPEELLSLLKMQNAKGQTPLHFPGNYPKLLPLLNRFTQNQLLSLLSIQDEKGNTPMHYPETLKLLMPFLQDKPGQLKAVLSIQDKSGDTPMNVFSLVKVLLPILVEKQNQLNSFLSVQNKTGDTLMHNSYSAKVLTDLLQQLPAEKQKELIGEKLNKLLRIRNNDGCTPLHIPGIVESLLPLVKKLPVDQLMKSLLIPNKEGKLALHDKQSPQAILHYKDLLKNAPFEELFQLFTQKDKSGKASIDDNDNYQLFLDILENHPEKANVPSKCYVTAIDNGSFKMVLKMAEKGDGNAMYLCGCCFLGRGPKPNAIDKDERKGLEWLENASTVGNLIAKVELAHCHEKGMEGIGLEANHEIAFNLCQVAAKQKEPSALYLLSRYYQEGIGVSPSENQSLEVLREAVALEGEKPSEGLKLYFSILNQKGKNLFDDKTAEIFMPLLEKKLPPEELLSLLKMQNAKDQTPLHFPGNIPFLIPLLNRLAINDLVSLLSIQDEKGNTPMHYAETLKLLMPFLQDKPKHLKAALSIQDKSGDTPMNVFSLVKVLLPVLVEKPDQFISFLLIQNKTGETLMHNSYSAKALTDFLQELPAEKQKELTGEQLTKLLVIQNSKGCTPMHAPEVVESLLSLLKELPVDQLMKALIIPGKEGKMALHDKQSPQAILHYKDLLKNAPFEELFQLFTQKDNSGKASIDDSDNYQLFLDILDNHPEKANVPIKCYLTAIDNGSFKMVLKMAERGDANAMYMCGTCYGNIGYAPTAVDKDVKEAFKWIDKSAGLGNADAINALAGLYRLGVGVDKNEQKAFQLMTKAAESQNVGALYRLSDYYRYGIGGNPDKDKSLEILRTAVTLNGEENLIDALWYFFVDMDHLEKNWSDDIQLTEILMPLLEKLPLHKDLGGYSLMFFPKIVSILMPLLKKLPAEKLMKLLEIQDKKGNTPLHYSNLAKILAPLLEKLSNEQKIELSVIQNKDGKTIPLSLIPLSYAWLTKTKKTRSQANVDPADYPQRAEKLSDEVPTLFDELKFGKGKGELNPGILSFVNDKKEKVTPTPFEIKEALTAMLTRIKNQEVWLGTPKERNEVHDYYSGILVDFEKIVDELNTRKDPVDTAGMLRDIATVHIRGRCGTAYLEDINAVVNILTMQGGEGLTTDSILEGIATKALQSVVENVCAKKNDLSVHSRTKLFFAVGLRPSDDEFVSLTTDEARKQIFQEWKLGPVLLMLKSGLKQISADDLRDWVKEQTPDNYVTSDDDLEIKASKNEAIEFEKDVITELAAELKPFKLSKDQIQKFTAFVTSKRGASLTIKLSESMTKAMDDLDLENKTLVGQATREDQLIEIFKENEPIRKNYKTIPEYSKAKVTFKDDLTNILNKNKLLRELEQITGKGMLVEELIEAKKNTDSKLIQWAIKQGIPYSHSSFGLPSRSIDNERRLKFANLYFEEDNTFNPKGLLLCLKKTGLIAANV